MKIHQIHDLDLNDESDFIRTQQSLIHKINLSPRHPSRLRQHLRRCRPRLLGAGRGTVRRMQYHRD